MDFFFGAHPLILYPFWVMLSPISQTMVSLNAEERERGMAAIVASDDNEIKKKLQPLPLLLPMMRERE